MEDVVFTDPGEVMEALYASISGPPGPRDFARLRTLFAPGAELVRTVEGEDGARVRDRMPVETFIERAGPQLEQTGFFEVEIVRKVDVFGSIAQVWSTYEARRDPSAEPFARGINGVQLFFGAAGWKITSLVWDDERPGARIPPEYLPEPKTASDEERFAASVVCTAKVVAVVGMKDDPVAPAFTVPEAMAGRGIRILPVNPKLGTVLGVRAVAALADLPERPDVVQVFRRSDAIPDVGREVLALPAALRPAVVWLQSGITHDETARSLRAAGIAVIQDRCFAVDMAKHRPPPSH